MNPSGVWLIVALFCVAGIILALLQINRIMDYSRTFFTRWKKDDRGDEGGIFTPLDRNERDALDTDRHRLGRGPIPESGLRADLPPGTSAEVERQVAETSVQPGLHREGADPLIRVRPSTEA